MSRNPIAAYLAPQRLHPGPGRVQGLPLGSPDRSGRLVNMGDTAENLARQYGISRERGRRLPPRSSSAPLRHGRAGLLAEETVPVTQREFRGRGPSTRAASGCGKASTGGPSTATSGPRPTRCWPSCARPSAACRPAAIRSAIVDGAAAALVGSSGYAKARRVEAAGAISRAPRWACRPEFMGIGPAPAIRAVLECRRADARPDRPHRDQRSTSAPRILAVRRELGLDEDRLNVNGGAIAHRPSARRDGRPPHGDPRERAAEIGPRYGIASACIGGGQGIALLIENPEHA